MTKTAIKSISVGTMDGTFEGTFSGYVFRAEHMLVGAAKYPCSPVEFELVEGGIRGTAPARLTVKGTEAELEIL